MGTQTIKSCLKQIKELPPSGVVPISGARPPFPDTPDAETEMFYHITDTITFKVIY